MFAPQDLHGVLAMMPAFATPDAGELGATATIDVDNLRAGVNRIVEDGIDSLATTGSFGELNTLLWDEFELITRATIEVVNKRVPLFIGCTSPGTREVIQKMRLARDAGAEGVLVGVPYYLPSTVENAVQFYRDLAELFPTLAIMIYHNPPLHRVTLTVEACEELTRIPSVVAMKETERDTNSFMKLMRVVKDRLSVFVHQREYHPYAELGAAGCWSIDAWMGPWPLLALRDAIARGDRERAEQLVLEITAGVSGPMPPAWRETALKLGVQFAGYCDPGPLRRPYVHVPAAVADGMRARAAYWQELCARYRPAGATSEPSR